MIALGATSFFWIIFIWFYCRRRSKRRAKRRQDFDWVVVNKNSEVFGETFEVHHKSVVNSMDWNDINIITPTFQPLSARNKETNPSLGVSMRNRLGVEAPSRIHLTPIITSKGILRNMHYLNKQFSLEGIDPELPASQ